MNVGAINGTSFTGQTKVQIARSELNQAKKMMGNAVTEEEKQVANELYQEAQANYNKVKVLAQDAKAARIAAVTEAADKKTFETAVNAVKDTPAQKARDWKAAKKAFKNGSISAEELEKAKQAWDATKEAGKARKAAAQVAAAEKEAVKEAAAKATKEEGKTVAETVAQAVKEEGKTVAETVDQAAKKSGNKAFKIAAAATAAAIAGAGIYVYNKNKAEDSENKDANKAA